jgi:hypothetical protein
MLKTTLKLDAVKVNTGNWAVVANLSDGREVFIANSDMVGRKRAIFDVLAGGGTTIEKSIRRLEESEAHTAKVNAKIAAEIAAAV